MTDINYIAARRNRGIPSQGKPLPRKQGPTPQPTYKQPKITKAECAAEYWRAIADLAMIPNADPQRADIENEAQTWHRFATTPHAFIGGING